MKLFSAGGAKQGKLLDLQTGQSMPFAEHSAPIKCAFFFDSSQMANILVTGSWDKTLKVHLVSLLVSLTASVLGLTYKCIGTDCAVAGTMLCHGHDKSNDDSGHCRETRVGVRCQQSKCSHEVHVITAEISNTQHCQLSRPGWICNGISGR